MFFSEGAGGGLTSYTTSTYLSRSALATANFRTAVTGKVTKTLFRDYLGGLEVGSWVLLSIMKEHHKIKSGEFARLPVRTEVYPMASVVSSSLVIALPVPPLSLSPLTPFRQLSPSPLLPMPATIHLRLSLSPSIPHASYSTRIKLHRPKRS